MEYVETFMVGWVAYQQTQITFLGHGRRIKSFWYSHNGSCLEMCLGVEFKLKCVYTPRFNLKHIQ